MSRKLTLLTLVAVLLATPLAPAALAAAPASSADHVDNPGQTPMKTVATGEDTPGLADQLLDFLTGLFGATWSGDPANAGGNPAEPGDRGGSFDPDVN